MRPLIDVTELAQLLDGDVTLLDVRWALGDTTGQDTYLRGHVPGAVYVDLETELSDPPGAGGRHPLPPREVFAAAMMRVGVSDERQVVAYDGGSNLGAARLWWMLTDAGHRQVRVLDGGYRAWVSAGLPLETGEVTPERGTFTSDPGHRPTLDPDGVLQHLRDGGALYDVRGADRYRGENETIDPVAGHIPGASNLPLATLLGTQGFAERDVLAARLSRLRAGDVLSCGSGITAAAVMLAAEQVGILDLVLFPGSWSEWIADPTRPIAEGSVPGLRPPV